MKFTEDDYWELLRFFSDMSTRGGCQGQAERNLSNVIRKFNEMGYELVKVSDRNE